MTLLNTESSLKGLIQEILPRVAKPARYTGGELNSVQKSPEEVSVRIALAFPDVYEVGMSNLGLRILYHILNSQAGVAAERVFSPASDMEAEMRSAGLPLFSLESSLPIKNFDVLGFSLSYEMSYTTVLNMLDLAEIPIYTRDRTNDDPIVIAGGHCASNPEPMADFIDAFAIGDGEEVILDIVREYASHRGNRQQVLQALAQIEGVYVPSIHDAETEIRARMVADLEKASFPDKLVVPFTEAVHERVVVEVMRGCSRGCRFCQAGMLTRPVRERSLGTLCKQVDTLLENTGYEEIALTSLSSADYSGINQLVHTLIDRYEADKIGISLPSLRADAGCVHLAADIQRVRKSGLTFAPEAGTQRLRDVINKNVSEEDLLGAVEAAVECGWRRIKLYFMIGLPTETDEDIEGIGKLVTRVIDIGRKHRQALTLNVTISPFVPKPHTPFQWRGMVDLEELERKISVVRPLLRGKNIQLSWHDPRCSRVEAALARGDRALSKVIHQVWKAGAKLEQDNFDSDRWLAAFNEAGLDIAHYANASIPREASLPWSHINVGVSSEFLAREDSMADSGETTPDCRYATCSRCGIRDSLTKVFGKVVSCPPPSPESDITTDVEPRVQTADQGVRVLFTFKKGDEVRWLGHLDLLRVFERAIRMSKVNIIFTQGFNPRVKMSIASALPLCATADKELVTIHIAEPIDLKDILSRLNHRLPNGLLLTQAELLSGFSRDFTITGSEFTVEVALSEGTTAADLESAINRLLSQPEILSERESGNKRKVIDLRPGIESLNVFEGSGDRSVRIVMTLPHLQFTVKPSEITKALDQDIQGIKILSIHRSNLLHTK